MSVHIKGKKTHKLKVVSHGTIACMIYLFHSSIAITTFSAVESFLWDQTKMFLNFNLLWFELKLVKAK